MKRPLSRGHKIAIAAVLVPVLLFILGLLNNHTSRNNIFGSVLTFLHIGNTQIYNNYENATSTPEDPIKKAHEKIDPLQAGQTVKFFRGKLGDEVTTNSWTDSKSQPAQEYSEYIFKGSILGTSDEDYYIQAITKNNSENVIFWSITICNPAITFEITNFITKNVITLNQSTFADVFPTKTPISKDPDSNADRLYYSPQGFSQNIFETEGANGDAHRIYAGVNNSCYDFESRVYFGFKKENGNYDSSPQFLQNISNNSDLMNFRRNTKINMIGFGRDDTSLYYVYSQEIGSQGYVGYNFQNFK